MAGASSVPLLNKVDPYFHTALIGLKGYGTYGDTSDASPIVPASTGERSRVVRFAKDRRTTQLHIAEQAAGQTSPSFGGGKCLRPEMHHIIYRRITR